MREKILKLATHMLTKFCHATLTFSAPKKFKSTIEFPEEVSSIQSRDGTYAMWWSLAWNGREIVSPRDNLPHLAGYFVPKSLCRAPICLSWRQLKLLLTIYLAWDKFLGEFLIISPYFFTNWPSFFLLIDSLAENSIQFFGELLRFAINVLWLSTF